MDWKIKINTRCRLEPSRVDTDVLNALGDQPITPEYPNVARWKKHVAGFTEETRNR